ncbi:MAG: putative integral membrane protein [Rhodobacteraceae bacterium HLUCCA08]|nr:MAG: putative integral membrane protein [Rhodobacteraceae bacterium HLUCCA08]
MASNMTDPTQPGNLAPPPTGVPRINTITVDDISAALKAGIADFRARPLLSGFFGLFYALFGILFVWCLFWLGKVWMVIPAAIAFPLVAPFACAGLYEMSRRRQAGEDFGWSDILSVMARQRQREMGWMAFVTLFALWVWFYQFRTLLVIILQDSSFSDLDGFLAVVFTTSEGWTFLAIGTCVGAFLSAVLFSVTVIAMPMLLDREVDFITAMITSVRAVRDNPVVMLAWAGIITLTMVVSLVPAFLGLIVTLPILGHTTWHLYRRTVAPAGG